MKKIIRHILEYSGKPCRSSYPPSETSQVEPTLHDLLVRYQNGLDISQFVTTPAVKATAEQQFSNRVGKVDPLTEVPAYINKVFKTEQPPEIDVNGNEKKIETVQTNVEENTKKD